MAALVPPNRISDEPFKYRNVQRGSPVEKTPTVTPLVPDTVNTITDPTLLWLNGQLVSIVTAAPPIPTDADFTLEIIDDTGATVHTEAGITDNTVVHTNTESDKLFLCGNYRIKITFTTALSGNTAEFDVYLLLV